MTMKVKVVTNRYLFDKSRSDDSKMKNFLHQYGKTLDKRSYRHFIRFLLIYVIIISMMFTSVRSKRERKENEK